MLVIRQVKKSAGAWSSGETNGWVRYLAGRLFQRIAFACNRRRVMTSTGHSSCPPCDTEDVAAGSLGLELWSRTLVSNSPVSGSRLEPANGLCARGGRLNSSAGLGDPGWLGKLTDGGVGVAAPPGYAAGVGVNGRSGGRGKCRLRKDAICFACGPPRGNRSSHRSRVARKRTGPDSSWNPAPFFLSVVT